MAKLTCTSGLNQGDEFTLHEGTNCIGRAEDADIKLFDKKCSRYHCQVFKKGQYYAVKDLGSSNGTWLGKKRLKKTKSCKPGAKIRIGATVLELGEKPVGGFVDQVATNVTADLQGKDYSQVFQSTKSDLKEWTEAHKKEKETPTLRERLKNLFSRK